MTHLQGKFRYTTEDILDFIENKIEESVRIQFRPGSFLQKSDEVEKQIATDISAFANSDGGIIIFGINKNGNRADELSFIDSGKFNEHWIDGIAFSYIEPKINGLRTCAVSFEDDPAKSVLVVRVPSSYYAPHQAPDKRFYRRFDNTSVPMEEYEIRNLLNRQERPKLVIEDLLLNNSHVAGAGEKLRFTNFMLKFQIRNVSNAIELIYKTVISLPKIAYIKASHSNPIQQYFIRSEQDRAFFSIPNKYPLFQDELTTVASALIRVDPETFDSLASPGISVTLYYSNGIDERSFDISNDIQYKGKNLLIGDFSRE